MGRLRMPNDIRTKGIVLRRTNYGECDRILNILTPEGKYAVLAKGVRKEKSRLAGGIELFTISDIVLHRGRGSLCTLTSAKMLKFYGNILNDLTRIEVASETLRKVDRAAEQTDNPEYFELLEQVLTELNKATSVEVVKFWFRLRMMLATGEEVNLLSDVNGAPLEAEQRYFWDGIEQAFRPHPKGNITATEIKLARLCAVSNLATISRIEKVEKLVVALESVVQE